MAELMQGLSAGDSSGAHQLDHYRAQLRRNAALEEVRGPVVAKHVLQRVKPAPETLPCVDFQAPGPTAAQLKHCQTPTARCRQSHLHRLSPSLPALVTKHSSSKVKSSPETLPHTDIPGPTAAESKHYQTPPVRWRYSSLHQLSPSLRAPMMKQPSPKAKHPPETLGTPDLVTPQPKHCHPPPASWQQTSLHEQSPSLPSQAPGHVAVQPKRCRTPPASWRQSFVHQLSPSLPSLCPLNQNTHGSRPASPGHMDPILVEMVRRRVRRVQKARLYLLRQPGPNTFSVGGDSPEHKFRVVIGPQTCSCNRGPHCLHLLFVMRRVFQVPENDPRLFAKELKNFEVESLFQNYKEQQNKRILKKQDNSNKLPNAACGYPLTGLHEAVQNFFDFQLSADTKTREDEKCPICLLEMTDGESLVECNSGCHNKLHHHCMAVWAAECVQQSEAVLCPLCRHPWMEKSVPNLQENVLLSSDHNSKRPKMSKNKAVRTSSMNTKLSDTSSPIPLQHMSMAADWIKILGSDLVTLLYSQDWKQRERGLQLLQDELHRQVQLSNEEWQQKVIRCCAKILAMLVGDPIFKVYSTCVVTWHHLNTRSYVEGINWKRGPALGTGAYSTCFQARDTMSGGIMAVKQVSFLRNSQQEQERVESEIWKEIVMLSKLHHPNVLHILGATKQNGHFNIFVEWMAGGSIATLLDSYGPFSESVIINYTKQTLQGLNYLHKNHILHRDLKGANLLIDSTGRNLCIGDFGAAVHLETQTVVSGELQGQILGTIAFMAPEVLRGENYEHSCDIWSVGCCIIEMVTTKPPWKENQMSNHLALMYKIASSKEPPFIPHTLGMLLKNVAHKCLQIKPELRPTAKELLNHECFINTPEYIGTCSNKV
ncbi:mitogen-activated protein kinase kinase kinase 1-like isoform X2 [Schistocerca cancellata]|uniref:mitogen-activated protein kinase kinase kinase 1-like isoform X2 n=1 Tax=Schistocerca cancellata TaxID=274614 RepID=UPI002119264D|nr:mitogen-activated protein kinase kinase kinase 1-like isoform X2 [Schistocerca cancellata]